LRHSETSPGIRFSKSTSASIAKPQADSKRLYPYGARCADLFKNAQRAEARALFPQQNETKKIFQIAILL